MHQTLTYWEHLGVDRFGAQSFAAPRQVACRWQDVAVLFRDAQGEQRTSSAVIYPIEQLELKGWVKRGIDYSVNPVGIPGAFQILQKADSPNLSGTITLNNVFI